MHESEPLQGLITPEQAQAFIESINNPPVLLESTPSTESRIIITLLMRLYDIQMALLSNVNHNAADRIFDKHAEGELFNPQMFIVDIVDEEVENND